MNIIKAAGLVFDYIRRDEEDKIEEKKRAIDHLDVEIEKGNFVAVLGHNGSGKSTFAKHINGILLPTEGEVWVAGMNTADEDRLWDVRKTAGMVFQNPDNQIIGNIVEEDVGFGPENLGVPTEEIWKRVDESLKAVGMTLYRKKSPNRLSGGQKQRVAIAGVMAMKPECIVLDEPTAMLDPNGRADVIRTVRELNQKEGITVVLITHYMEEVIHADRVIVMDDGRVVMDGTPREVFAQVQQLKEYRLDVPQVTELAWELKNAGINMPEGILDRKEFTNAFLSVCPGELLKKPAAEEPRSSETAKEAGGKEGQGETAIKAIDLNFKYSSGTAFEQQALKDVSFEVRDGEFIGLIGHTGSGKSTLIQHLNGLIRPTSGDILFHGTSIYSEGYSMKELRSKVGLVFQYPEHQLFEADVFSDVCFGPKNLGLSAEEVEKRARHALKLVGLDEKFYKRSPFELSGGQKRRVAIAGVLAMRPEVMILDEPTAGLDPRGRDEILEQIERLNRQHGLTIILVSHSMEDVARYVDRLMVMDHGRKVFDGTPKEVFRHWKELESMGLAAPQVTYLVQELRAEGVGISDTITTVEEARDALLSFLGRQERV